MSRRRRQMALGFVVVVAAVGLAYSRPWQKPPPIVIDAPALDPLNPAKLVTLAIINSAGEPCTVSMTGHYGNTLDRATFTKLSPSETRSRGVPGPYTLDTVTVERGGKSHRQELNVTIPGGESRQLTVNADDTVEVGPAPG